MKKLYTFILLIALAATAQANVIKAIKTNANWNAASTWDKNRSPINGDTIVIPATYLVKITSFISLNSVLVKIYGNLDFNGGKLDLDDASVIDVFLGGLITGVGSNDQIRIGNNHVFKGSWPDVVGPMFADKTTGNGFMPLAMLPVTFVNFYVSKYNNDVRLTWATATETNNNHFEIEKSIDGTNWSTIGMVLGAGNSTSINSYSFTDKNVKASVVYYRIKQVDIDGKYQYTSIKSVKTQEAKSSTQIFASNNSIIVKFEQPKENVTVKVIAMNGQVVSQQNVQHAGVMLSINSNVKQSGLYVVQVIDQDNSFESKKVFFN